MCFSPSVSFGAGIVLSATGITSISRSQTLPQRVLSVIPLLFAVQQFSEGVVWLSMLYTAWAHWQVMATYIFLVFAQIVWPVYVPFSMLLFEHNKVRKKAIIATLIAGVFLATYIGISLYLHTPVAIASSHHIAYELNFSLAHQWYYGVLYFIPTIVSSLISSQKRLHWLGYLFLGSYLFTRLLFHYYVISVWCFFGAAISIIILWIVIQTNKESAVKLETA